MDKLIKPSSNTDQISRSILQKAIRRGDYELTKKAIAYLIINKDSVWLKKRLAVITFEECWNYGLEVTYEENLEIVAYHYLNIVRTTKNRNAAGLGSLAFALSEGNKSVFETNKGDRDIKIICEAMNRPNDFWAWIESQSVNENQEKIINAAKKGYRLASWPWDKAFTQAAAYLAVTDETPLIKPLNITTDPDFPLWIGIDKHTPEGKIAIKQAAKEIGVNSNTAMWLNFYFESAQCNALECSPWWEREIRWRMRTLYISVEEGKEIWDQLKPIVKNLLKEETALLKSKLDNSILSPEILRNNQTTFF